MQLPEHKLIQYCPTRWNSVFDMFDRILQQRWPVSAVLSDRSLTKLSDARVLDLKEETWRIIEDMLKCLESLNLSTEVLSGDKNVSVSFVLPVVYSLINKHLKVEQDESDIAKQFKTMVSEDLRSRYKHVIDIEKEEDEVNEKEISPLIIACFLDPRHKHMPFFSNSAKEKVYNDIRKN